MNVTSAIARDEAVDESGPIRVMIVDDSAVTRGMLRQWLDADPGIHVVFTSPNGRVAVRNLPTCQAEVVILDIEMPIMDGMTALPLLLDIDENVKIIIASTLTTRNAEISMTALEKGAADYIPKPQASREVSQADEFRREIIEKVKVHGAARRKHRQARTGALKRRAEAEVARRAAAKAAETAGITLRPLSSRQPKVLAVGSSTGGPQALFKFLSALPKSVHQPILITQHMPATFTAILADHLRRAIGRECREAEDGLKVEEGQVYIAQGGKHMAIEKQGADVVVRVNENPPENYCRPAVDPLFRSVAAVYGPSALAVVLTGMGQDGLKGARSIVEAGGSLLAQDEASSVVWGMPGAVANAGLCSAILDLELLAPEVAKICAGGGR